MINNTDGLNSEMFDLLIKNGIVLTMDSQMRRIDNGYVAVKDGQIVEIGSGSSEKEILIRATEVIDARGGIIMPGLINSHTHASMTLFRGLADDLPLMEWLNNHIFPAESRLTPNWVYTGAKLACAEMILSGTTCFCDMYLFEDEVAKAAYDSSMRAVVGEVLYDFPSPCYGTIEQGFEYVAAMTKKWNGNSCSLSANSDSFNRGSSPLYDSASLNSGSNPLHNSGTLNSVADTSVANSSSLITVAVEPHSTYLCSPDLLHRAAELARKNRSPLVIHVAETLNECAQIKERYGVTPARFLADIGVLGPNLVACHSIHLTERDMDLYKAFDVKVAHCPESNMKLASGVALVPQMIERGICVGLGTDGCASNNDLDLFLEMDTTAKLHKIFSMNPEALNAETALQMATINGARALGLDSITGSLEVGKRADIIVVSTSAPHMVPMYNPYSHLVYSATGSDVSSTIIDGRIVMKDRKLLTIDVASLMDEAREIAGLLVG
ncbi:MAG: amidohydrolase [Desulfamplus sp.]|nr:amidohydrolase [Desulfamplus sp.]